MNSGEKSFFEVGLNFISPASITMLFNNLVKPKILFLLLDKVLAILNEPRPSAFNCYASSMATSSDISSQVCPYIFFSTIL
jgi:hypothetical protein